MKSIRLFTLVLAICFSLPFALFAQQDTLRASSYDMQQQVHRALRQIIDSTDYSLSDIQFDQEIRETTMRSKATFFGHKAVQTKAVFTSFGRLVFFEAISRKELTFPSMVN